MSNTCRPCDKWAVSAASLEGYRKIAGGPHRATLLETEQAWLAAVKPDLVVSDVVPLACAAAAAVRIPCVCISNFSWGEDHHLECLPQPEVCTALLTRLPAHIQVYRMASSTR